MASETNVTIYIFNDPACKATCKATLAAFRAKGCELDLRHTSLDDLRRLLIEGFDRCQSCDWLARVRYGKDISLLE